MSWIDLGADRTNTDVDTAITLINKVSSGGYTSLTSSEKALWDAGLKGCLNYADANNIENNWGYLQDKAEELGHIVSAQLKIDWEIGDMPRVSDWKRQFEAFFELLDSVNPEWGSDLAAQLDITAKEYQEWFKDYLMSRPTSFRSPSIVDYNTIKSYQNELKEIMEIKIPVAYVFAGEEYSGGVV